MLKMSACFMAAALAACVTLSSCSKQSTMEKIKATGEMVVYTNPEFPPYEYLGANKEIVGAEIDLVHKIAEKLGVKVNIVASEFDAILMTVETGKADMGASGFTINEERKKKVDFSIPFVSSVQYLIVAENSPIKTVEDLKGKKIGGQNGTTGFLMCEDAVNKGLLMDSGAEMKSYNNAPDAVVAMKEGKVDAVVIDDLVAKSLATKNPGYKAIPLVTADGAGLDAPEEFGIMIAKGNEDLLQVINEVIEECKANGFIEQQLLKHNEAATAK